MDKWFTIDQIDEDTYIISEYRHWEETHCYLLNGSSRSLLIDTGLGICNIYDEVMKLTNKPITAVAILIILPLCYLSLVIGIISIVILAVQLLTEVKTIKRQYNVMRTLGNEVIVLEKMLRDHIFLYFALPFIPAIVIGSCLLKSMSHTLFIASYDVPVFDNLTALIALVVLSALLIFTLIYLLYAFIASQSMRKEIIPLTLEK